jgi:ribosomal protein S18 acetylase RimI-like enzyme
MLVLGLLCVHPDFQRQGIGKDLVQWGLRRAADLGLTVHLEASPEGLPLYRSLGFEVVETVVVGANEWDGGFERKYVVMIREPIVTSQVLENAQH